MVHAGLVESANELKSPYEPAGARATVRDDVRELPGLSVRFSALLSDDLKHRFTLVREWDPGKGRLLWIGLNPARADYQESDTSSAAVMKFAQANGFGRVDVGNLLSVREVNPSKVLAADSIRDPDTDIHLRGMIGAADQIVVGWGTGQVPGKNQRIARLLQMCHGRDLYAFGDPLTYGQPRHPATRNGALPLAKRWLKSQL